MTTIAVGLVLVLLAGVALVVIGVFVDNDAGLAATQAVRPFARA